MARYDCINCCHSAALRSGELLPVQMDTAILETRTSCGGCKPTLCSIATVCFPRQCRCRRGCSTRIKPATAPRPRFSFEKSRRFFAWRRLFAAIALCTSPLYAFPIVEPSATFRRTPAAAEFKTWISQSPSPSETSLACCFDRAAPFSLGAPCSNRHSLLRSLYQTTASTRGWSLPIQSPRTCSGPSAPSLCVGPRPLGLRLLLALTPSPAVVRPTRAPNSTSCLCSSDCALAEPPVRFVCVWAVEILETQRHGRSVDVYALPLVPQRSLARVVSSCAVASGREASSRLLIFARWREPPPLS